MTDRLLESLLRRQEEERVARHRTWRIILERSRDDVVVRTMRDMYEAGRVTWEGMIAQLLELTLAEREQWRRIALDAAALQVPAMIILPERPHG